MKKFFSVIILSMIFTNPSYGQNLPQNECNDWQNQHPEWIFCDDFESGTPTTGTGSYFEYNNDEGDFVAMNGVGINDSSAMRVLWQQSEAPAGDLKLSFGRNPNSYMNTGIRSSEDFREIYYRMFVKMESGWTGNPYKLSRATIFTDASVWKQAMIAHIWQGNQNQLAMDPASCIDGSNNVACETYNDFGKLQWLGLKNGQTQIFETSEAGKWFCVETHVKLNDPGQANGVLEFWVNEQLEAGSNNLNFVRSYTDYGINAVFFENYWNGGSPQEQTRYFDNIVVSTQPIGCYTTSSTNNGGDGSNNNSSVNNSSNNTSTQESGGGSINFLLILLLLGLFYQRKLSTFKN